MEKLQKANKDFQLFNGAKKILVGLSGGADSTCLLVSLCELSGLYGFELYALHINHMIRGQEADRDEEFARSLCKRYGVEFFCERIDVPSLAQKSGESLELCARNERYRAFERVCVEQGIAHIATAHNACDNAETVLFNLVRGSGTRGLCGIPPKRSLGDATVIRPLIYAERFEIEQYLREKNQDFVTDSTNSDSDYTRNYIRNEIMPRLRRVNESLEECLSRSARLHRIDEEYLSQQAQQSLCDDIAVLSQLHESVLSRVIISLFSSVSDELLPEIHIRELCAKIRGYDGGKVTVSLPDGLCARLYRGRLSFEKDKRGEKRECDFNVETGEGAVFFEENPYALYISFDQNEDIPQTLENKENIYKKYTTDYLYFDTIPRVLGVRNRQDGDKIYCGRMNKSIKRLLTDSDYADSERYYVPFVCEKGEILLVPGVAACDGCRQSAQRTKRVSVTLYRLVT